MFGLVDVWQAMTRVFDIAHAGVSVFPFKRDIVSLARHFAQASVFLIIGAWDVNAD
jgi:hypothetical protein